MITVEYVREKYPEEYGDLSDEQVQDVINLFSGVVNIVFEHMKEHPGESIFKPKSKEIEPIFDKQRHSKNKIPPRASLDEKIKRHIDHIAHCKCRPIPKKIKQEIEKRLGN